MTVHVAEVFAHPRFGRFRAVRDNEDNVLFVARDIARCLGFRKPTNAINNHCKGAIKVPVWNTLRVIEMIVIPMSEVERLAAIKLPPYYACAESASPGEPFLEWVRASIAAWDTELDWKRDHHGK